MTSTSFAKWVNPHMSLTFKYQFYEVPNECAAIFSTKNGTIKKRQLPKQPSPAIIRSDHEAGIRKKASQLRQEFPAMVRAIAYPPTTWNDLYKYFDGVDLWQESPAFLFYVISHISNENFQMDAETEEYKLNEVRNWAEHWINHNLSTVVNSPPNSDLMQFFDEATKQCLVGVEQKYIIHLRSDLDRLRHERRRDMPPPMEHTRQKAPSQSFQGMYQSAQAPSFHPGQHQQHHAMVQGTPVIQHSQPIAGRPFNMAAEEHHRNQMVPIQPVQPLQPMYPQNPASQAALGYHSFMQQQRNLSGPDFRNDYHSSWERKQRGHAHETNRGGRGGKWHTHRGANNPNFQPVVDRRMGANVTPRGSPPRRNPHLNQATEGPSPVYVHNSQRQSPSYNVDTTPRASDRVMLQSDHRNPSDSPSGRSGFPNDARVRLFNERQRANSKPQEYANSLVIPPPFQNDERAVIKIQQSPFEHNSQCTYWYVGPPRPPTEDQLPRTVFVRGFLQKDFESHNLEKIFAKYGPVESICYMFAANANNLGNGDSRPAFVVYMKEESIDHAIQGLQGYHMNSSGSSLQVNRPHARSRTTSWSNQISNEHDRYSTFTGNRNNRGNNRRNSIRNQSFSHRPPTFASAAEGQGFAQNTSGPSDGPTLPQTILTEGFQAQLQPTNPFNMQLTPEALNASVTEVVQHNAAMNRYPNASQFPLGNIGNHTDFRPGRTHPRDISPKYNNSGNSILSQGSYNRKENSSPKKKGSTKNTPYTSPKKSSSHLQDVENSPRHDWSKNKKKAKKQTASTRPSRAPSPMRSDFDEKVIASLAHEQQLGNNFSASEIPQSNPPILEVIQSPIETPKADTTNTTSNVEGKAADGTTIGPEDTGTTLSVGDPVIEPVPFPSPLSQASNTKHKDVGVSDETEIHVEKSPDSAVFMTSGTGEFVLAGDGEPKPTKSKSKKKKRKSIPKFDQEHPGTSLTPDVSFENDRSSTLIKPTENLAMILPSLNSSLTPGPSDTVACDAATHKFNSLEATFATSSPRVGSHQAGNKHSKNNSNASTGSLQTPKSTVKTSKKSRETHSKKGSNDSTFSAGSVRKTDTLSRSSGPKVDETLKPAASPDPQKENQPSSPALTVEDPKPWSAVVAAKAPVATIKLSAVSTPQPLAERKKNPNGPIIPALPLNMPRGRGS